MSCVIRKLSTDDKKTFAGCFWSEPLAEKAMQIIYAESLQSLIPQYVKQFNHSFISWKGVPVTASEIDYNGQPSVCFTMLKTTPVTYRFNPTTNLMESVSYCLEKGLRSPRKTKTRGQLDKSPVRKPSQVKKTGVLN